MGLFLGGRKSGRVKGWFDVENTLERSPISRAQIKNKDDFPLVGSPAGWTLRAEIKVGQSSIDPESA